MEGYAMTQRIKVAVLISGEGSNLQALMDASREADYPAEISFVLSNKSDAKGLERAATAGIETLVLDHKNYDGREAFDAAMTQALEARGIQLVCLAGFMRILNDEFVNHWRGKLINIHPSLLPKYKGLDTHARVLEAGDKEHGATVHWVIPELDSGETIAQEKVKICSDDTIDSLKQKVHTLEHWLYPQALKKVAYLLLNR